MIAGSIFLRLLFRSSIKHPRTIKDNHGSAGYVPLRISRSNHSSIPTEETLSVQLRFIPFISPMKIGENIRIRSKESFTLWESFTKAGPNIEPIASSVSTPGVIHRNLPPLSRFSEILTNIWHNVRIITRGKIQLNQD